MAQTIAPRHTQQGVLHIHHWTASLWSLRITRPAHFQFTPGQFARLGLVCPETGKTFFRPYSVLSSPEEDFLEFLLTLIPSGPFSHLLAQLSVHAPILLEETSYGVMTADRFVDGKILWMLATGTGLGPFISIAKQKIVQEKFPDIVIVHGVRFATEFAYQEHLRVLAQAAKTRFHILGSTTRDPTNTNNLQGRIPQLLDQGILEAKTGLSISVDTSRFMLCGNPAMIQETRDWLTKRGFSPCRRAKSGQFLTEGYW